MKKIAALLTIFVLVLSCTSEKEMKLSGTIKGLKKGTLLLQKFEDTLLVSVDSVKIDGDAIFHFTREIESPEEYFLYLRLKDGTLLDDRVPFFAEPGEIKINTSLKKFNTDARIEGSLNEMKRAEYTKIVTRYSDKNLEYLQEKLLATVEGRDSIAEVFQKKQQSIINSKYLATVNYAINNNDFEISPYLALTAISDANVKYLDTIYKTLTPKIKKSTYGEILKNYIAEQNKE